MKKVLLLAILVMMGCAQMEPGVDTSPNPFHVWGCEFSNVPDLRIVLDLSDGQYGQRAIFLEYLFMPGEPVHILPIDYQFFPDKVIHYGGSLGGPERTLEYDLSSDEMIILDAAEGMQSGMGDLHCHKTTEELL